MRCATTWSPKIIKDLKTLKALDVSPYSKHHPNTVRLDQKRGSSTRSRSGEPASEVNYHIALEANPTIVWLDTSGCQVSVGGVKRPADHLKRPRHRVRPQTRVRPIGVFDPGAWIDPSMGTPKNIKKGHSATHSGRALGKKRGSGRVQIGHPALKMECNCQQKLIWSGLNMWVKWNHILSKTTLLYGLFWGCSGGIAYTVYSILYIRITITHLCI